MVWRSFMIDKLLGSSCPLRQNGGLFQCFKHSIFIIHVLPIDFFFRD